MLDQNTDRMWFVIGAVIVGAAIIFIANGTLPDIFASVTETFEGASSDALSVVDKIGTVQDNRNIVFSNNLLNDKTYVKSRWVSNTTGALTVESGQDHSASDYIPVIGGAIYEFSGDNGLHNPSIGYFTADHKFISGRKPHGNNLYNVRTTAPINAKYARVSARDAGYAKSAWTTSRWDRWLFRQVISEEKGVK